MSERTVKASRRQVRRAVGQQSLALLEKVVQSVEADGEEIARHRQDIADLGAGFKMLGDRHAELLAEVLALNTKLANELLPRSKTFRGRLSYLVFGV